jgi:tryptophan 2,3-dioxygenase
MIDKQITYASYLSLPNLLGAQAPLTPGTDPVTRTAERFFIVCHQASELWASQVLADLAQAASMANVRDWRQVGVGFARSASIVELLTEHLARLMLLPTECFLRFRTALDGASGADSVQMNELLRGRHQRHVRRVQEVLEEVLPALGPGAPHPRARCAHGECHCAQALDAFGMAVSGWRSLHVRVARHFIGDLPGTGGTSGVDYLLGRERDQPLVALSAD